MENKKDFPIQKTWLLSMKQSWKSKKYKRKDLMSIIHYKNSFSKFANQQGPSQTQPRVKKHLNNNEYTPQSLRQFSTFLTPSNAPNF